MVWSRSGAPQAVSCGWVTSWSAVMAMPVAVAAVRLRPAARLRRRRFFGLGARWAAWLTSCSLLFSVVVDTIMGRLTRFSFCGPAANSLRPLPTYLAVVVCGVREDRGYERRGTPQEDPVVGSLLSQSVVCAGARSTETRR